MKVVSFRVAKAIKEAGYPQSCTPYMYVTKNYSTFKEGECIDSFFSVSAGDNVVDAPYVMDVWLWLHDNKLYIDIDTMANGKSSATVIVKHEKNFCADNPEAAIIAAIDYLAENNLIKVIY